MQSPNRELTFVRLHHDLQYPPVGMINKTMVVGAPGNIKIDKLEFVGDCLEVTATKQGVTTIIGTPKTNIDLYAFTIKKEVVNGLQGLTAVATKGGVSGPASTSPAKAKA